MSWLDVKLGLRMLVKYPGLSLVGGVGMATAIAIGAVFAAMVAVYYADLPFADGDRVVAIEEWDTEVNNQERRILHDFATWREQLTSVVDLGAYQTIERNLIPAHGAAQPIRIAEMTASGFQLARVSPLMGRYLVASDERAGAPPVVVIGYDIWQTRFAGDLGLIGQTVHLGNTARTVVGVMPQGFAFPVNHGVWIPFREDPSDYAQRQGPGIYVFGRLAPGVTLDQAQAELTTVGHRLAAAFPETHARLRPRVMPYTVQLFDDAESGMIPFAQLIVILLLVEICVNVAILVYARTATRRGEIAVRNALGRAAAASWRSSSWRRWCSRAPRRRSDSWLPDWPSGSSASSSHCSSRAASRSGCTSACPRRRWCMRLPSRPSRRRSPASCPHSRRPDVACTWRSNTFRRVARGCASDGVGPCWSSPRLRSPSPSCRRPSTTPGRTSNPESPPRRSQRTRRENSSRPGFRWAGRFLRARRPRRTSANSPRAMRSARPSWCGASRLNLASPL